MESGSEKLRWILVIINGNTERKSNSARS